MDDTPKTVCRVSVSTATLIIPLHANFTLTHTPAHVQAHTQPVARPRLNSALLQPTNLGVSWSLTTLGKSAKVSNTEWREGSYRTCLLRIKQYQSKNAYLRTTG